MPPKNNKHPEDWDRFGLYDLSGKTLADIVGSIRKPLAKAYGHLFAEKAGERNIFGGEGGWRFPLASNIRGRIHARRFEKGLRSGDTKAYGSRSAPFSVSRGKGWYIPSVSRTEGEWVADESTKSRSDASMYLALDMPAGELLKTIAHEGGHMEPMFGDQISHITYEGGQTSMGQDVFEKYVNKPIHDYYKQLHTRRGDYQRPRHSYFEESEEQYGRRVDKANELYELLEIIDDSASSQDPINPNWYARQQ